MVKSREKKQRKAFNHLEAKVKMEKEEYKEQDKIEKKKKSIKFQTYQ